MEYLLEEIREEQKESWNMFSPGWRKWDKLTMDFLKPIGDVMIRQLNPQDGDVVLDVASGTGEPGLTIASMLRTDRVVMADLSANMLEIAREHAAKRGINNVETVVCDVCELPFENNTFDAISCRFGYMFFPDMQLASREMARVLKTGGRMSASVWGAPEKNFWVTAIMGTIREFMEIPTPLPEAPGMFRCAEDGLLTRLFSQAGLKNIRQKEVPTKLNTVTTDRYWNMMNEVGAPIVAALSEADDITRQKIKNEVFRKLNQAYDDGNIAIDASALVIYGEK